jgi:hypothetical protein
VGIQSFLAHEDRDLRRRAAFRGRLSSPRRALFAVIRGECLKAETAWRRGVDSNPRCREGSSERNSARVCGTIWPDEKHPRRREFVRLEFGSASALPGIRRRLVAQQPQLNFHSSIGLVHEDVAYRQPDRETWPSSRI